MGRRRKGAMARNRQKRTRSGRRNRRQTCSMTGGPSEPTPTEHPPKPPQRRYLPGRMTCREPRGAGEAERVAVKQRGQQRGEEEGRESNGEGSGEDSSIGGTKGD